MFQDASEIMGSDPEGCHRHHVTRFHWDGFRPVVEQREISTGEMSVLQLQPLDLFVSEARRCVGDGSPCGKPLDGRMQVCRSCDSFPVPECRFQPRCHGTVCPNPVCSEPHVVYLAFFGRLVKVGMTRLSRLQERGVEQGADIIVPLQSHESRRDARAAEQALSKGQGFTQSMSLQTLTENLDDAAAERARETLGSMGIEGCGPPLVLDGYPLRGLERIPRLMPTAGKHRGDLLGVKGRLAVYRDEVGALKALDLKDLPARFVGTAPSRCGQSTLF